MVEVSFEGNSSMSLKHNAETHEIEKLYHVAKHTTYFVGVVFSLVHDNLY